MPRPLLTFNTMLGTSNPREIALATHRDYHRGGSYNTDRLFWTLDTFLPSSNLGKVLEIGCGDGAMLQLHADREVNAIGVDASASGINRCATAGLRAQCLAASTDGLPFPDESFDVVISFDTFEHLMNPCHALQEVQRTLRNEERFLGSIPNPRTGHPYSYPGLFEYKNFRQFLEQTGIHIERVEHWECAAREMTLPRAFRRVPILSGRFITGALRRLVEKFYRNAGAYPSFCYWLWTSDCSNHKHRSLDLYRDTAKPTQPGTVSGFNPSK
jgi:SAM-dependent methyltransferase